MQVEFWFDVVCPYAWVASTRVPWFERVTGAKVRWRPILLGGVFRAIGSPDVPVSAMSAACARYTALDVQRSAALAGVDVRYPPNHPRRTVEAMRLLTAAPDEVVPALAHALWRAYWTDNLDPTDRSVLASLGAQHGVDAAAIDRADVRDRLFENTAEAVARGVFGVPTFTAGDRLHWGADRLDALASELGGAAPPTFPRGPVEVFHDFSSPYSYLGVAALLAAGAEVSLHPMLLGALFNEIGAPNVPVATFSAPKQRWVARDLEAQAAWRGLPFRFSSHFPLRTVTALRVALVDPGATGALYRAAWVEDVDLGRPEALRDVLDADGRDGASLIEAAGRPDIKQRLRENTARAASIGAPGAPTFLVGGALYWGQDRLAQAAALEGSGAA